MVPPTPPVVDLLRTNITQNSLEHRQTLSINAGASPDNKGRCDWLPLITFVPYERLNFLKLPNNHQDCP